MRTCPNFLASFGNMINEGNIPDDMKNIISSFASGNSGSNDASESETNSTSNIDFETILKMKSIMEKLNNNNDPRANLLLSLKPYLKESRKEKVDQYIKLFGMSKVLEVFNNSGGEQKK